jgi:hypothetical protein
VEPRAGAGDAQEQKVGGAGGSGACRIEHRPPGDGAGELTRFVPSLIVVLGIASIGAQLAAQDHPGQYSQADIDAGTRVYSTQCALVVDTTSTMPSYSDTLTSIEVSDPVAFLLSLKGA